MSIASTRRRANNTTYKSFLPCLSHDFHNSVCHTLLAIFSALRPFYFFLFFFQGPPSVNQTGIKRSTRHRRLMCDENVYISPSDPFFLRVPLRNEMCTVSASSKLWAISRTRSFLEHFSRVAFKNSFVWSRAVD